MRYFSQLILVPYNYAIHIPQISFLKLPDHSYPLNPTFYYVPDFEVVQRNAMFLKTEYILLPSPYMLYKFSHLYPLNPYVCIRT